MMKFRATPIRWFSSSLLLERPTRNLGQLIASEHRTQKADTAALVEYGRPINGGGGILNGPFRD
jgi:hypothetical protein